MFRVIILLIAFLGFSMIATLPAEETEQAFAPQQDKIPVKPPQGAIVLFDGEGTNLFLSKEGKACRWKIEEGTLISTGNGVRANHIVSTLHFRDADIHVEFNVVPQASGNSGVYIHGNYEMQIYNSHGKKELTDHDEGSLYGFQKPLVNAARPAGEWQVYDIRYRAPRRNEKKEITEEGMITAWLNGQKVQDKTRFGEPRSTYHPYRYETTPYLKTIWEHQLKSMTGPVFLQDHDSPCRFRNVWVKPLDDKSFMYEPQGE